jgi:signal transduction histidine kinase
MLKTNFVRMVSHELRTPLTTIKLNLDRLARLRDTPLAGPDADAVRRMATASDRLFELIESLIAYAQIESGRIQVEIEPVDVASMLRGVVASLETEADQKAIALRFADPGPLPPARSDPRLLRLIAVNLVQNAIKFTARGGVEVSAGWHEGEHRLRVRDEGIGISSEDRSRIFEPFEQVEPISSRSFRGMGLGLAIAGELVRALGGRIDLTSELGQGSTFEVVLPAQHRASQPDVSQAPISVDAPRSVDLH